MLPPIGTHRARASGPLVVYEAKSGALCVAIPVSFEIGAGEQDGWTWSGKHTMTIFKADGEAMIDNINTLREVFDWDGLDPFMLGQTEDGTPRDLSSKEFNIVGAHEEFIPEGGEEPRTAFKIKWLNSLSRAAKMPEAGDRKSILTKYGSKLRALAGPAAPKPADKPKPAETPKPTEPKKETKAPAPPTPPSQKKPETAGGQPVTSTMEEAWAALVKANPGTNEQDLGDKFWAVVGEVANGKQNSDLTIQEWGKVKTKLVG